MTAMSSSMRIFLILAVALSFIFLVAFVLSHFEIIVTGIPNNLLLFFSILLAMPGLILSLLKKDTAKESYDQQSEEKQDYRMIVLATAIFSGLLSYTVVLAISQEHFYLGKGLMITWGMGILAILVIVFFYFRSRKQHP